jgi:hypothetical protein
VQKITGKPCAFHKVDLLDKEALRQVFRQAGHDKLKETFEICSLCHSKTIHAFVFCAASSKFATERLFKLLCFLDKEAFRQVQETGRTLQTNANSE